MKALCLLILSAIFDCSLAYTIVERPANVDEKQFSYNRIPSSVVQERPPVGFWFQQHPYNLPKPDPQALFELYYLIEVITLYRRVHPRAHRSHLDNLIEELQDEDFQLKIRLELQGMQELNIQQAYGELNLHDYAPFVNDRRQLIPAIHRTLSEIHLESIKDKELRWTLERLKEESTAMTIKMARKEAEVLKELIESNRKQEKAWTIADILAAVFGKQDESTMKDFEQKYEVVDDGKPVDDGKVEEFWVVFEDDKKEVTLTTTSTEPAPFQFVDENYEQFEAKQEVETDVKLESIEQSAEHSSEAKAVEDFEEEEATEQLAEQETEPKEEVETVEEEAVEDVVEQESTIEREEAVDEEEVVESLEQESIDDLDGEQRIETDGFVFKDENYERSDVDEEDYERTVPEEDDQSYVEEVVAEEELPDAVPEELQTLEDVPEQEYTDEVEEERQVLDPSIEAEPEPEPEYTEEFKEEPLDASVKSQEQPEPEYIEELEEDPQSSVDPEEFSEELTEDIPESAAAKASPDSITFPDDPQWVEDSVRPVGSSAATSLDSSPPKVAYDSEELPWPMEDVVKPDAAPVTQSVPLWISKGYTAEYEGREVVNEENLSGDVQEANDLESRAEPVGTAQIDTETLQYVAFEILKVVSLLEDNAGFTGLRDQITSEDVDALIERLSMEQFVELINEQGIDKVELINAVERLIVEKNLENAGEIVGVLDQWKQGEDGRIMEEDAQEEQVDGVEEAEAGPELKSNDLLEETASVDDGYFSENYGKAGGEEDEIEGRMLEEDEVTTSEEAQEQLVESSDDQEQVEAESEDVQEMKSNSDLEDALEELEAEPELKSNDLLQESVDDGYFSENYGKAGDDEDGIEGRMLKEDDLATSEEAQEQLVGEVESNAGQVEGSDDLVQVEVESEDIQEFKSNVLFEDALADDGYFSETYGKSADQVEGRTLEEDDHVEESEQIVATPDEAKDAELLVDELEGKLKGDVELQVDSKDTLDEIAAESDSVQKLKTGDLVEDAELLNDSPELLDDASDLSESISKVKAEEESKNLQPFPEEVTEDTAPVEEVQRTVEEKILQPFPEEITEDTVPIEERLVVEKKLQPFPEEVTEDTVPAEQFDAKKLEPFPEQTLDEATPLEIALEDQLDQLETIPDQIVNETLADPDNPRIVPVSNRPFLETSADGSEPLEVARAGTDEGTLEDEDRREEILEDQHPEP